MPHTHELPLFNKQTPEFLHVHTNDIKPWTSTGNPNNVKASISALGMLTTILLRRTPHDPTFSYEVVDGTRRLDALTNNGEDPQQVPALVLPSTTTNVEAHAAAASLNLNRNTNPISEARNFQAMHDAGTSLETIAQELGISISTIRSRLKLLTLPEDILTAAEQNHIATTAAQRITNLPQPIIKNLQETLATKGRLTLEDVNNARKINRTNQLNALPPELFAPTPELNAAATFATQLRNAIANAQEAGLSPLEIEQCLNTAVATLPTTNSGAYTHAPY